MLISVVADSMGPTTRSSRRNPILRNVLNDKTNMSNKTKTNENKEQQCVYSHNNGVESHESLNVYDFMGTNSPPRKVIKKRKRQHIKKLLSKSGDEVKFKMKKVENIKYNTRQRQIVYANNKDRSNCVKKVSFLSEDEVNILDKGREKENADPKQNDKILNENKSMRDNLDSINVRSFEKAESKPLHDIDVFTSDIRQDISNIPADSEHEENITDTDFRRSGYSFAFSPSEQKRNYYVTKRPDKKTYSVNDFTIENCFGFDESVEDMKSPEHNSVMYALCSTPNDEGKPTRPILQRSQILKSATPNDKGKPTRPILHTSQLLSTNVNQSLKKTIVATKKAISKERPCVNSQTVSPVSLKANGCSNTNKQQCVDVTSSKISPDTSVQLPQVVCTKSQDLSTTEEQLTSPILSNQAIGLFDDNIEQHFSKVR